MTTLYYPKRMKFVDYGRNFEVVGPGEFEVEEDAVEEYLDCGWEEIEDTGDATEESEELCGSELNAGGTCERLASVCPYH